MNLQRCGLLLLVSIPLIARAALGESIPADVLLTGGTVIDGSGAEAVVGDVAIRSGVIIGVGSSEGIDATWTINCSGLIVCPGFIDLHNHSDRQIVTPATRAAVNYVTQGCTTIVTGNCGSGPVNVSDYYSQIDEHGAGVNVAHLLPQGSLRNRVIGDTLREPTTEELAELKKLTGKAMSDGAWGMSTGLIYVPSSYASTDELIAIAEVVAEHGGIYASHIRGEGTGLLNSVDEALQIGRAAHLPVHISHFKSSGRDAWGLVRQAAINIAKARDAGQTVTADQYPYIASSTSLGATLLPAWAREGGRKSLVKRLDSDESGPRLRSLVKASIEKRSDGATVRIARYAPRKDWVGLSLQQISQKEKRDALEIALEIFRGGGASIVNFSMSEDDVRHIVAIDWVATASDGRAYLPGADKPHPRNYGTFARKIGHYSLREEVLSIEDAIRSATGLPADIMGINDRGYLRKKMSADIAVFDPQEFRDAATFAEPHQYCQGLRYVFVNGSPALVQGIPTGTLAGRALRHATSNSE